MGSILPLGIFCDGATVTCVLLLLIAVISIKYYIKCYKRDERFMELARQIPGPVPLPLIGTVYMNAAYSWDLFQSVKALCKAYGPVSGHWVGPEFITYICKAKDIEAILNNKLALDKPPICRFMEPLLGRGLITSYGDRWYEKKRLLTPTFHNKVLDDYVSVFISKSRLMTDKLESEVDNLHFDIQPYFNDCTFDMICESAMSTDLDSKMLDGDVGFGRAMELARNTCITRMMKPWLQPDFLFKLSTTGKKQKKYLVSLEKYFTKVIRRKKEIMKKQNTVVEVTDEDRCGKTKYALLDYLLKYLDGGNSPLSDDDIRDEVTTFMVAGTETTATALGFISYELSKHLDVQENIVQEILREFGSLEDLPVTYYNLQNLNYLERVIKEVLRLYPSVPIIARNIPVEAKLPSGYTIPAGSTALLIAYLLHRDPDSYQDPDVFNPDNFLPEKTVGRHPYAYCPFSAGPRYCIGHKYAMMQMKTVVVCLLRKFWLLPSGVELNLSSEIVLRSTSGIHVRLKRRSKEKPII